MSKTKPINWAKMRSDIVRRLTTETSKEVSLTADSNVSQTKKPEQPKPKLPQRDASRMQTPEARARRIVALADNRKRRLKAKEACKAYRQKNGLQCISVLLPADVRLLFNARCDSEGVRYGDKLRELITEYITRPDKS